MSFLHPEFLYLFLLIPILIAINLFLKGKRTLQVTNIFIWEKFHEVSKSKRFNFKRIKSLPLLLQILFVILSAVALSQPAFFKTIKEADRAVFIIDSSMSMNARTDGKQHINLAKEKAIQFLKGAYESSRVMIVKADSDPEVVHPYSLQTNRLFKAIDEITPTDTIANLDKAITKVCSLREVPSKIVVFTSNIPNKTGSKSNENDLIDWVSVGGPIENVRISNLDIRQNSSADRSYQTFFRINNDSDKDQSLALKVYYEDELYEVRDVVMKPREDKAFLVPLNQIREGLIRIRLDVDDDLEADNEVFALLEPEKLLSVLLVTSGNRFLENALAFHNSVDLDLCDASSFEENIQAGNYDVVIYDNVTQDLPVLSDSILICSEKEEYVDIEKGFVFPELLNFNHGHRCLRGLDLSNLSIQKSYILNVPDWGETLIKSEHGALMFCGERDNRKILVVGFDLMHSNFPLEIAFPVFISRLVNWFMDYEHKNWITAGEPYYYTVPSSSEEILVTITRPDGKQIAYEVKNNLISFTDTLNAGVYKIECDTFQKRFVVNYQTDRITDTDYSLKGAIQHSEASLPETIPQKLGILFVFLSLGVLVMEWYCYVRT